MLAAHHRQASILITGSEVLDGRVPDTNSHLIIDRLVQHGFVVAHTLSAPDDIKAMREALEFLLARSSVVIVSGGMGPTSDDLTREMAADFFQAPLEERAEALEKLKAYYHSRGRTYDNSNYNSNYKQVLFPRGSTIIPNAVGTAPGFLIAANLAGQKKWVVALPGVPGELRKMLDEETIPRLCREVLQVTEANQKQASRALRMFGMPESTIGAKVLAASLPPEITVSYRAAFPEVHVVLKAPSPDYSPEILAAAARQAREALGAEFVFSESLEESFDACVHGLLRRSEFTLSAAESCTGGMLGEMLTQLPGSSRTFLGSAVTYSNQSKQKLLQVREQSLASDGAVSASVVREMARGARDSFGSTFAVSISGIAGPDGGSEEKPVGTFFIGFATPNEVQAYRVFFPSSRQRIRRYATYCALEVVRRHLLSLPLPWLGAPMTRCV